MEIARHQEKIARLGDLLTRLDPVDDFELWMWTCMTAATNALNAALHHLGLSEPGPYFPYQIPGLYVEPKPTAPWQWRRLFAAPGDVIHIGLPPLACEIPASIAEAVHALDRIEDFRERYVRGGADATAAHAASCAAAYRECMTILDGILAGPGGSAGASAEN